MNDEQVLQLVDSLFHEFASSYRSEARQRAVEKLTAHNTGSLQCVVCGSHRVAVIHRCDECSADIDIDNWRDHTQQAGA